MHWQGRDAILLPQPQAPSPDRAQAPGSLVFFRHSFSKPAPGTCLPRVGQCPGAAGNPRAERGRSNTQARLLRGTLLLHIENTVPATQCPVREHCSASGSCSQTLSRNTDPLSHNLRPARHGMRFDELTPSCALMSSHLGLALKYCDKRDTRKERSNPRHSDAIGINQTHYRRPGARACQPPARPKQDAPQHQPLVDLPRRGVREGQGLLKQGRLAATQRGKTVSGCMIT